jgi:hypothetical protein
MKPYVIPTIRVRALCMESLLAGSEKYLPYNPKTPTHESLSKTYEFWDD